MTDTTTTDERKPYTRSVEYTFELVDDLPEGGIQASGTRSPLEEKLVEIVNSSEYHAPTLKDAGKSGWILLGKYGNQSAASAAVNVFRQRHGRTPAAEGFSFAAKRMGDVTGLFVSYDPSQVVPGAKEQHTKDEAKRQEAIEKARAEREAAANGAGGSDTRKEREKSGKPQARPSESGKVSK